MARNYNGRKTSFVYLARDGKYLILHRTSVRSWRPVCLPIACGFKRLWHN